MWRSSCVSLSRDFSPERHPSIRHIHVKTGAQNIAKEIKQYQEKWLQHVQRMDTKRIPKQALQYKRKGRRNRGRPRRRWREQLHLEDQGTGNTPNPSWTWWWWWWWSSILFLLWVTSTYIHQGPPSVASLIKKSLTFYVCICGLFNNASNNADCITSHDIMIGE